MINGMFWYLIDIDKDMGWDGTRMEWCGKVILAFVVIDKYITMTSQWN